MPQGAYARSLCLVDGFLYAATWGSGAFCSHDSGRTWQKITPESALNHIYTIVCSKNGKLLAGTTGGIYVSPADTIRWQQIRNGQIETTKALEIIVGSYGCQGPGDGVFVSLDHGQTWTTATQGLETMSIHALYKAPGGDLFAGTGTGDPNDGGAVYWGMEQRAVAAAARKLGVSIPGQVTLTSPAMNTDHNLLEVVLKWQKVPHGAMYHLQVATDVGFSQLVHERETALAEAKVGNLSRKTDYYWRVRAVNALGPGPWSQTWRFSTSELAEVEDDQWSRPPSFTLHQNYPNPFNLATTMAFDLPQRAKVQIAVFDVAGQKVRTIDLGWRGTGRHRVVWDGLDDSGLAVASGLYFCLIRVQGAMTHYSAMRKTMLLK